MNIFSSKVIKIIIILIALIVGSLAYLITKKQDSLIEQAAESILMAHGIDIDLSPDD